MEKLILLFSMSIFRSLFILVFVHLQIYYNAQQINFPNDKFEFTSTEQSNGSYTFNFKLDQLGLSKTLANNQFYTELSINGFFEHQEIGLPAFPQLNQLIEVPQHGKINICLIGLIDFYCIRMGWIHTILGSIFFVLINVFFIWIFCIK